MYRTEKWLNEVKGQKLKTPVFIMSMNRPNPPLFNALKDFQKDEVFVFIRNTTEQQRMYEPWSDYFTLVTLPDWVTDAGETREAMLQYAIQNDFDNTFVLDDRVTKVRILVPKTSRTGNQSLSAYPASFYEGLLVWERILQQHPFTLSAPCHSGFSYFAENINAPYTVNNGIIAAAININIKDIAKYNIHYKSLKLTGGDDFAFLIDTMKAGLPTCKITDLEYTEIPSDKISGGTHTDTRVKNMTDRVNTLMEYLGEESKTYTYVHRIRGVPYPYIKWKYWQEYYTSHLAKSSTTQLSIPGDTGKPWRFNKMIEYIGNFPDEIGPIINAWFNHIKATDDDKVWWVFLYSTCYCMGSAMLMSKTLDYKQPITDSMLNDYWEQNKPKLIFQSDRRYIKNMNQFTTMVKEFLYRTGGHLYEYISQFITNDPEITYQRLYKEISTWKYYARFGTILFIFNLCKVFPHIKVESKVYDWRKGATTTSAIFNVRYEDHRANLFDAGKSTLSKEDIQMLNASLMLVTQGLQKYKPDKQWDIIHVSSDLCSFRKLFKGTRYQGFYVDRQQEEIQILQANYPEHKDIWQFIWDSRKKYIDDKYLGEIHGWYGIRNSRMKLFLDYGYVGADYNFPEVKNYENC